MRTPPPSNNESPRLFLKSPNHRPIPPSNIAENEKPRANAIWFPSFRGKENAASVAGAVIASVEVPGLEPTVTGDGETLQVAIGDGPVTAQVNVTGPEKPFCPANVKASVTCAPVCAVKVVDAGTTVKSGAGRLNVQSGEFAESRSGPVCHRLCRWPYHCRKGRS